jgi:carbonic anhydrase/acetyltransferase-like protein (isoleucine patch superfamily)
METVIPVWVFHDGYTRDSGEKMTLYEFEERKPRVGGSSFVCDSADVIGNVEIGEGCFIGPGARLRGDYGRIRVGSNSSLEDNCVVHARPDEECVIGEFVTIGHNATIHNCRIRDYAIVGMSATVSDYAQVGEWAVVGEGAVVANKQQIPPAKIAVGVPARVIGDVSEGFKEQWMNFKEIYVALAKDRYPRGLKTIPTESQGVTDG